ncbi:MAG: CbtB-domain containing protein [Parvibaculaceae bacterium]|nr:CbtB-domain containing protein [Parvibaculaceae bacterium]
MTTQVSSQLSSRGAIAGSSLQAERLKVALPVFLMGAALIFVVGFAHPQALHDAAHDTRHALSFPCH